MLRRLGKIGRILRGEWSAARTYLSLRECRRLRFASPLPEDAPRALFVSLTHHPVYAVIEGILLLALRGRGVRPVVLTYGTAHWAIRTFRLFGFRDFLHFDAFLGEASRSDDDHLLDAIFGSSVTFKQLLDATIDGNDTGAHALSTVVRKLRTGGGALDDTRTLAVIRSAFLESVRAARAARLLFERHAFAHVLFHEKGYTPFGELFDEALERGCNVAQYYFGQEPNSIVFKRYTTANRRQHPFSLSSETWRRVLGEPWSSSQEEAFLADLRRGYEEGTWFGRKFLLKGKRLKPPEEVRAQLHLDPGKKTAVVYSHILWDATFFYGENLFDDYEHWLVETIRVACGNTAVNWVVKLHPDYVWKMKDMPAGTEARDVIALRGSFGTLPPHIQVVMPDIDITTYSFFAVTDYCITVRGTIGTEAPCFGIPVFTAGTGRYSGLGFTVDSSTREEYLDHMRHIQDVAPLDEEQTTLARRHAYALFRRRLWKHSSFSTDRTVLKAGSLSHNVAVHVQSRRDVERSEDLRAFAGWFLDTRDEDYLAPAEAAGAASSA